MRWLHAATIGLSVTVTAAQEAALIDVGLNVQVSRPLADRPHDEVFIDADPDDPNRLIACGMSGVSSLGERAVNTYVTHDGGRTWALTLISRATRDVPYRWMGDPGCAFGRGGRAYVAAIATEDINRLRAWTSEDAGQTWREAAMTSSEIPDRITMLADTVSDKYAGRVYIYGQSIGWGLDGKRVPLGAAGMALSLWRSVDAGLTYERPIQRFPTSGSGSIGPSSARVLSDGTVVGLLSWSRALHVVTSNDGGATLDPIVKVADRVNNGDDSDVATGPEGGSYLAADVFTDTFRDRLYVVWSDRRFGNRGQVLIAHSSDKGRSWSKPRFVSDDRTPRRGEIERPAGPPLAAVNRDGVVGVWWQDRRENRDNKWDYDVRFAASFDGGLTFTPSVRVSEQRHTVGGAERWITRGYALEPGNVRIIRDEWVGGGHYAGIAVDAAGGFHPLWVDNRTGIHQMWTARVTVRGKAVRNGSPDLSMLDDFTPEVSLDILDNAFDRTNEELTITLRLKNVSKRWIHRPVKLRLLNALSSFATPEVLDPENGVHRDGAVWDFSALVPPDGLKPGEASLERRLRFRMKDLQPYREDGNLLELDAMVLGRTGAAAKRR